MNDDSRNTGIGWGPPPAAVEAGKAGSERRFRIAILGGQQTGKTYLFKSMVYRAWLGRDESAALGGFLSNRASEILRSDSPNVPPSPIPIPDFLADYLDWDIASTVIPTRYQFRMYLEAGWLGGASDHLEINYIDTRGERLEQADPEHLEAARDANVVLFCVPSWVAFPIENLSPEVLDQLSRYRRGIQDTLDAYRVFLQGAGKRKRTRMIVALTMADDWRCSLAELRSRWIDPYVGEQGESAPDDFRRIHTVLQTQGGLMAYLADARKISDYLEACFKDHPDRAIRSIPNTLRGLAGTDPWFVALTAVRGAYLQQLAAVSPEERIRIKKEILRDPRPAHVELPLLMAMCQDRQALM